MKLSCLQLEISHELVGGLESNCLAIILGIIKIWLVSGDLDLIFMVASKLHTCRSNLSVCGRKKYVFPQKIQDLNKFH